MLKPPINMLPERKIKIHTADSENEDDASELNNVKVFDISTPSQDQEFTGEVHKLTLKELREMAKDMGISRQGTKSDLQKAIMLKQSDVITVEEE